MTANHVLRDRKCAMDTSTVEVGRTKWAAVSSYVWRSYSEFLCLKLRKKLFKKLTSLRLLWLTPCLVQIDTVLPSDWLENSIHSCLNRHSFSQDLVVLHLRSITLTVILPNIRSFMGAYNYRSTETNRLLCLKIHVHKFRLMFKSAFI